MQRNKKMEQSDFEAAVDDAEKNGAVAAQESLINRVLRKKNEGSLTLNLKRELIPY